MKNILLATDLSSGAAGATAYAAWLASVLEVRLTLMSAYRPAPVFAGSSIPESWDDRLPDLVHRRLEETATRLRTENRIPVDVVERTGHPAQAILSAALDSHADLIVVGKAGAERVHKPGLAHVDKAGTVRREGRAFGDTVVALARKTTIPLLIVPQAAACVAPKAIAVAKDLLIEDTPEALRILLGCFASQLYSFAVKPTGSGEVVEVYRADALHSARELFHLHYEIPVDTKLRHSMENFIEVAPIHWLAARPLSGISPERWLLKGQSRELAFDIRVPLLILPEPPKKAAAGRHRKNF